MEEDGKHMGMENILDKLDDLTLEQVEIFKANMEKNIQRKVEEKVKREKFEDPRNEKMMGEIYPNG